MKIIKFIKNLFRRKKVILRHNTQFCEIEIDKKDVGKHGLKLNVLYCEEKQVSSMLDFFKYNKEQDFEIVIRSKGHHNKINTNSNNGKSNSCFSLFSFGNKVNQTIK